MPEGRPDLNYADKLNAADGIGTVILPVHLSQIEHHQVYRQDNAPRWVSWTRIWPTKNGDLRVSFTELTGGSTDMGPSYSHEYASPEKLKEFGIKRQFHWCESKDNGQTWQTVRIIDHSDMYLPQIDECLLLNDGTLLGVGGIWSGWDEQKNTYDNIGQTMVWLSSDDGETWSKPVVLNDPKLVQSYWCHPKQLKNGTIILPTYGCYNMNSPNPQTDAFMYFSYDGGKSWSQPLLLAEGLEYMSQDEPEAVELENGDILVVIRHANPNSAEGESLYINCGQLIVKKTHSGWQPGEQQTTNMEFRGFPALLRTHDNILICTGSCQQYNFSVDNGQTWSQTGRLMDPQYPRINHYPILKELSDGRIISVYHYGNHWPFPPPEDEWIHATIFKISRI